MRGREAVFNDFYRWGFDSRGWAKSTRTKYLIELQCAERFLRERKSSVLWASPKDLRAYLFSKPAVARTRNYSRQVLVAFGDFLLEAGLANVNNASGLPRLPEPASLPKALEREEAGRIDVVAPAFGPMADALICLYLYGGLRRDEARCLERPQILEGGQYVEVHGKGAKTRTVPICNRAQSRIKFWLNQCPDARWFFPSDRMPNQPISQAYVKVLVREVGEAAGVPRLHPHAMRHTVATTMLENGATVREVQEMLGHARIQTTVIYTRVRPTRLRAAAELIDYRRD